MRNSRSYVLRNHLRMSGGVMRPGTPQPVASERPFDGLKGFKTAFGLGAPGTRYIRWVNNSSSNDSCPRICGRNTSLVDNDTCSLNLSDTELPVISMLGWSLGSTRTPTHGSLKGCEMSSTGWETSVLMYCKFRSKKQSSWLTCGNLIGGVLSNWSLAAPVASPL